MSDPHHTDKNTLATNRIEALTDGIFAFAMTLLVVTIDFPKKGVETAGPSLHRYVAGQSQEIFNFILSFALIARFWIIQHRQSAFIRRTDQFHLWINIVLLMAIVLVPYTTSLVGDFPEDWLAELLFSANILAISLLLYLNWHYVASNASLAAESLDREAVASGKRQLLLFCLISATAAAVSLVKPSLASFTYLAIPVIMTAVNWIRRARAAA